MNLKRNAQWITSTILFLGGAYYFSSHTNVDSIHRAPATDAPPPIAGEIWTSKNDEQVARVLASSEKIIKKNMGHSKLQRRDAHPKQHGCARALVDIDSRPLPAEFRVGVFAPPADDSKPVHFEAWTRFSNGSPTSMTTPDGDKDVRGFALKLMNVTEAESGSQDFLFTSSEAFFSVDGEGYTGFNEAMAEGEIAALLYLGFHGDFRDRLMAARIKINNVLQQNYYSTVPYRLGGENSMRFSTTPCTPKEQWDAAPTGKEDTPNYLRERLAKNLGASDSQCFKFFVQPNRNPAAQPVENPTLLWDPNTSPIYQVGTITFPGNQNDIDSPSQNALCENLTFNPWHSMPETRPLGQINRIRRVLYGKTSEERHLHNGVPMIEPHDLKPCEGPDSALCKIVAP